MEHAAAHPWLVALEQSALGATMRQSLVLYPLVEVLHILGLALLVGGIAVFDLRVLGLGRRGPLLPVAHVAVPVAAGGFALAVPTGLLLFATEATHVAVNPAFLAKMGFVAVGVVNVVLFHAGPWRKMAGWGAEGGRASRRAKAGAAVSLLAWFGALAGGRLIAYV